MDQERLSKLKKLPELGIQAYPENYLGKVSSTEAFKKAEEGMRSIDELKAGAQPNIRLAGRMMTYRAHGKISFAQLQDFDGRIQVCFMKDITTIKDLDTEQMGAHKFWEKMLDLGDYIGVEGELFQTNHGETTLLVTELTFLGKALHPMPEKFHGVADDEIILRQRYLDTLTNQESRKRFKMRSDIIKSIRKFFWANEFDEVETPTLEHGATGAAAKPYFTHNNALDIDLVLRISQELPLKKIILGGFERVFEIGKAFRNEGIDPSHLPEHTHFEWYAAYWSFKENMDYTEKLIKHVIAENNIDPVVPIKDKEGNVQMVDFGKDEWERIDYVDLIEKDSGINIMEVTEVEELRAKITEKGIQIPDMENMLYPTLVDYLYKKVSRPKIVGPAFLYNYPKALQPLARVNDENPDMVDQFQLLVNGWEIVKGYSELVDPIDQAERFKEQEGAIEVGDEEAMQGDDDYITAMEHGMPPISGVGLGLDRFVTLLSQQDNLRDCVFFPLMRPKGGQKVTAPKKEAKTYDNLPSREDAFALVEKYHEEGGIQHAQMTEISMRTLAKHFGENEEVWGLVGMLHDIDWDIAKKEDNLIHDPERFKSLLGEINLPQELIDDILSHDESQGLEADTLIRQAIRATDELSGFIGAVAKVRPEKMKGIKAKSVAKKVKDKGFAAAVNRDHLKYCESLLNIPLSDFLNILLPELEARSDEYGL